MDPLSRLGITAEMLARIAALEEFRGRWGAMERLAPDRLSALQRVATIESVGSSTRIEGARLGDEEVERLLGGLSIRSLATRDEQEVAGYAAAMDLVFASWPEITLTENHVQQLHGVLLQHSTKDERHRGRYKTLPNHVVAFDADGASLGVVFETASPFDTPRLTDALISWCRLALEEASHHPLLVLAAFVVRFLAIHPFQDGNGRLSRILTTLLLLRSGYTYVPYSSLERIIEQRKSAYYLALRRAQATLDGDESELGAWVTFFLDALVTQKEHLEHKLERERLLTALPPLSEKLLALVHDHGKLTVRDAAALTGASRNTIKDHLRRLVDAGRLSRQGKGRGTWYGRASGGGGPETAHSPPT